MHANACYASDKRWSVELSGANLGDTRYQRAQGYDALRRSVFLNGDFKAFY